MDGTGVVNTTTCAHCRREVDYSANATHFFANWCCGWQDLESGLSAYVWSVGTLPGAADIVPWTDVGLAEGASAHGLSMEHGSNVSACVYAINGVGTRSATVCSDGVVIDLTPPEMVYVTDGFEVFDIDQQSFVNSMFARFRAVDNESYVFECVLPPPCPWHRASRADAKRLHDCFGAGTSGCWGQRPGPTTFSIWRRAATSTSTLCTCAASLASLKQGASTTPLCWPQTTLAWRVPPCHLMELSLVALKPC